MTVASLVPDKKPTYSSQSTCSSPVKRATPGQTALAWCLQENNIIGNFVKNEGCCHVSARLTPHTSHVFSWHCAGPEQGGSESVMNLRPLSADFHYKLQPATSLPECQHRAKANSQDSTHCPLQQVR